MKWIIGIVSTLCVVLSCIGCSPDEPTINSFVDNWQLIATSPNGLTVYAMPEGVITTKMNFGTGVTYPVTRVRAFRDEIFVVEHTPSQISVLSRFSLQVLDTIELGANTMHEITFANATTAYATVPAQNKVLVIDLTTRTVAAEIPCSGMPMGIACAGNQLAVACQSSNQIAIIDTRTNIETARIAVGIAPTFVETDVVTGTFINLSLGDGKVNSAAQTVPKFAAINSFSSSLIREVELSTKFSEASQLRPTSMVTNASSFAFAAAQNGLSRVSTGRSGRSQLVQFDALSLVTYNPARAEVLQVLADGRTVTVLDEYGETVKTTVVLQDSTSQLLGIAP